MSLPSGWAGILTDAIINGASYLYMTSGTGAYSDSVDFFVQTRNSGAIPLFATRQANSLLYGAGTPTTGVGRSGDFYIDTATYTIYGPRSSSSWPAGTLLTSPTGTILYAANTVYVDRTYGSDSLGVRGRIDKPFFTLTGAKNAAQAGDVVHVRPGTYVVTGNLSKNRVDWYFEPNSYVTANFASGIWHETLAATFSVNGYGKFYNTNANGSIINVIESNVDFECDTATSNGDTFKLDLSYLKLNANHVATSGSDKYAIYLAESSFIANNIGTDEYASRRQYLGNSNSSSGIYVGNGSTAKIANCYIQGVVRATGSDVSIYSSYIKGTDKTLDVAGTSSDVYRISDTYIESTTSNAVYGRVANTVVYLNSCQLKSSALYGISGAASPFYVKIIGNTVSNKTTGQHITTQYGTFTVDSSF